MQTVTISPIGYIQTDFPEKFGIPRQSGRTGNLLSRVYLYPPYDTPDALREIEGFSHIWLLFDFSLARGKPFSATVRPPKLGGNKRVGVFASRSPFRPNHIGLSCVELVRVEKTPKLALVVRGADLLDGTPIFDIKPYLSFTDCILDAKGGYAERHADEKLQVEVDESLLSRIPTEKRDGLIECLADDPRPSYQEDKTRVYKMSFDAFTIHFQVDENVLKIVDILPL